MGVDELEAKVRALGFTRFGIADATPAESIDAYRSWLDRGYHGSMDYLRRHAELKTSPESLLPGVRSVIAVGLDYYQPDDGVRPRVARYAWGRDYHRIFRRRLSRLVREISSSEPDARFRITVDSAPILEREYAHRAGLGWFGKNTMLIDSRRGSWFLIGLVLTTLELPASTRSLGGCGICTSCIDACPTGAIVNVEGAWQVDARQCISYLTIEAPQEADSRIGDWLFGCDVCQEVCPFNHPGPRQPDRATPTQDPDLVTKSALVQMDRNALSRLSLAEWDATTIGSPLRRQGYDGFRQVLASADTERTHPSRDTAPDG
ncbi:MAG: tRNA epoxyqueuosine(34) reductase QueG [Methanoregulaceae archaeon]|nr:tRNA epoxyqueuosine(34) reductase QueG [Methanoregulaceae archaeon]